MPYLNVYGTNIVYDRWGSGPDTVLVGHDAAEWRGCPLPGGRRYLAADLPGFGRSASAEKLGEDDLAEHLITLLVMLHLTGAELWVHPQARKIGVYMSERLGLVAVPAPPCLGDPAS